MGFDSECLQIFPAGLTIDVSKIGNDVLSKVSNPSAYFELFQQRLDNGQKKFVVASADLQEFWGSTLKLLGYLEKDVTFEWRTALLEIGRQNPKAKIVTFHFFCVDNDTPYCFELDNVKQEVFFIKGPAFHAAYFDRVGMNEDDDHYECEFNVDRWVETYKFLYLDRRLVPSNGVNLNA
jgi:hypothetical protein